MRKMQPCLVHRLRIVAVKLSRHQRESPRWPSVSTTSPHAQRRKPSSASGSRRESWQREAERPVHSLENDFYYVSHDYAFPPELWQIIGTTNLLDQTYREYSRGTRLMRRMRTRGLPRELTAT